MRANSKLKENIEEVEFTEEETMNQMIENEEDFLENLLSAADYLSETRKKIEIIRNGKLYYRFTIRPLTEKQTTEIRKECTKYTINKDTGIAVQEEVDNVKFRSALIYHATIDEDKERIWDNKNLRTGLINKGFSIVDKMDVINILLLPAERNRVIKILDSLGGFNGVSSVNVVKN